MAVAFPLQAGLEFLYPVTKIIGLNGLGMRLTAEEMAQHMNFAKHTCSKFRGYVRVADNCPVCAGNTSSHIGLCPKTLQFFFIGESTDTPQHTGMAAVKFLLQEPGRLGIRTRFIHEMSMDVVFWSLGGDLDPHTPRNLENVRMREAGADNGALEISGNLPQCKTALVGNSKFAWTFGFAL